MSYVEVGKENSSSIHLYYEDHGSGFGAQDGVSLFADCIDSCGDSRPRLSSRAKL